VIEGEPAPDDTRVRFGRMDRDQMLLRAVTYSRSPDEVYRKTQGLDREKISELAELAIEVGNVPALIGLAKRNRFVVAQTLGREEKSSDLLVENAESDNWELLDLYYMVKDNLPEGLRRFFLSLTCKIVLRSALRIAGRGIRKDLVRVTEYAPGMEEFDLDQTLENYMQYGAIGFNEIVALERIERKKAGILILDTSGSMYREKLAIAAVSIAVLAYSMKYDDYAIVLFDSRSRILKSFQSSANIQDMIETIFGLKPSGFTNIEGALRTAYEEITKIRRLDKWAVIVTDGDYNVGADPRPVAAMFPRLNVIRIGGIRKGEQTCRDMAQLGHGKYETVRDYRNLPLALLKIMR